MRPIRCARTFIVLGALLTQCAGCESPPTTTQQATSPPAAGQAMPQEAEYDGVAPEIQALAEQSQKDVAAILQARAQSPLVGDSLEAQPHAEPRRVIWNDSSPQALPAAWSAP